MSLVEDLLRRLGDGRPRSRQQLCRELKASPESLATARAELSALGLAFAESTADSLKLQSAIEWLDLARMEAATAALGLDLSMSLLCPSTNLSLLSDIDHRPLPCVLLSEGQSSGRGRRGRSWSSPPGGGVYLSLGWRSPRPLAELAALSLIGGMAAARALNRFTLPPVRVKWPNDLQVNGRKLGGCLVDVTGSADGPSEVVIGVGINVRIPAGSTIDQPWTDLISLGCKADRTSLAIAIMTALVEDLRVFDSQGSAALLAAWPSLDALTDQAVAVSWDDGRQVHGTAAGINHLGQLRLATDQGELAVHSGEVRVRAA